MPPANDHDLIHVNLKGSKVKEIRGHGYLWVQPQSCPIIGVYVSGGGRVLIATSKHHLLEVCGLVEGEYLGAHPSPAQGV